MKLPEAPEPLPAEGTAGPMPWTGKAERVDRVIIVGLVVSGLYALLLLPLTPALIDSHPLALEIIRGSVSSIITMGALARTGDASLAVAVLAAIPALVMFDWVFWLAGRRWGHRAVTMFLGNGAKRGRQVRRLEGVMRRLGPYAVLFGYVLPLPTALIDAAAGWIGMRLRTFLILDLLGALLWTGLLAGLGYAIGQPAVDVAHAVGRYALWFTLGIVALIVAKQMRDGKAAA
ncbi:MAG: VTT domain-containing protein [Solirubrobacteraceae bacterium]